MALGCDLLAVCRLRADAQIDAGGRACLRVEGRAAPRPARASRRDRLRLSDDDRGAGQVAPNGPARHPRRCCDHRSGGDALLGRAGNRPAPRDSSGIDRGGARGRRCGFRRAGRAWVDEAGVRETVRPARGACGARAPRRRQDRARLRRRLGRGRSRERRRRGARPEWHGRRVSVRPQRGAAREAARPLPRPGPGSHWSASRSR